MAHLTKTLAFALAVAAVFSGCAAAATLAFSSKSLAAGNAAVSSCGITSLFATRRVDNAGNVTRVDVASIPLAPHDVRVDCVVTERRSIDGLRTP